MSQLEIWALPGQPLKEEDWLKSGFDSLADYVQHELNNHSGHMRKGCIHCDKIKNEPLVSFGTFNPSTGKKVVKMVCNTKEDLPTKSIKNILIFNK